jgi:hypothetical protein
MSMRRDRTSALANSNPFVTSIWMHRHTVGTQTSPPPEESLELRSALAAPPITIVAGDVFLMEHRGERSSFVRLNKDRTCSLMTLYGWECVPKIATPLKSTWSVTGQVLTFKCRCYDENDNTREAFHSLKTLTEAGWEVEPPLAQDCTEIDLVRCTATFFDSECLVGIGFASLAYLGPGGPRRPIRLHRAIRPEEAPSIHSRFVQNAWDFMHERFRP